MSHTPRAMEDADLAPLAQIWHDAWHLAHGAYLPMELVTQRTLQAFADRLPDLRHDVRVAGPLGAPFGLCAIRDDELNQIFVAQSAHGTGLAQDLLNDGEARIAAANYQKAWLKVVPENLRAIAFYRKSGWIEAGREPVHLDGVAPISPIEVLIFRKTVAP